MRPRHSQAGSLGLLATDAVSLYRRVPAGMFRSDATHPWSSALPCLSCIIAHATRARGGSSAAVTMAVQLTRLSAGVNWIQHCLYMYNVFGVSRTKVNGQPPLHDIYRMRSVHAHVQHAGEVEFAKASVHTDHDEGFSGTLKTL